MEVIGWMIAILTIISIFIGIGAYTANSEIVDKCKRENNVYDCKVIAVPIGGQ